MLPNRKAGACKGEGFYANLHAIEDLLRLLGL